MAVPATSLASSQTAQSVTNAQWYSTIVVENASGVAQYVRTDGVVAVAAAAGCEQVPIGATMAFPNQQPLPNANGNGGVPLKFGFTTQQNNMPYTNVGDPTYVSVIAAAGSATGDVTVSLQ